LRTRPYEAAGKRRFISGELLLKKKQQQKMEEEIREKKELNTGLQNDLTSSQPENVGADG